jgi:anti-sigma factor RsiW
MHLLVQADLDGELAPAEAAEVAAHLAGCAACRAVQTRLAELSRELRVQLPRYAAPDRLRARLQVQAQPSAQRLRLGLRRLQWRDGVGFGLGLALAASVLLVTLPPSGPGNLALDEAVTSHVRALQPGHLTDVLSTDQHTVKPWFDGRTDFAPPVRDFAAEGFPLIGGRLDYLGRRPVAALVYRRDKHVIDLYVAPAAAASQRANGSRDGYNVIGWQAEGMSFMAVSDLNLAELQQFADLWQGRGG